jgi:hypothetical protein
MPHTCQVGDRVRLVRGLSHRGAGDMLWIMHGGHIGARNHRKLLQLCNQMCVKIV